tara:strand:- start:460 stop:636 length:177 start_codon:yes stop_codon:yes gene_type:complete
MSKILVIGAGAWGTALANVLAKKKIKFMFGPEIQLLSLKLIINPLIKNILKIYSYQKN